MSETAQNVLNTILFHTGEQSSRFMLVLATNRPHELDEALLDRMDVVLQVIYRRRNVVRFVLAGRVYLFPRVAIPPLGAIAYRRDHCHAAGFLPVASSSSSLCTPLMLQW